MAAITATHIASDQFLLDIRDHGLLVDQPASEGGWDSGPTPTELFVGGLVACVAHYAHRYLVRHELDTDNLRVTGDWELSPEGPARVARVAIRIDVPDSVPQARRAALLAVASHCTVHNSLANAPTVTVALAQNAAGAAA
ncbi:MAG TPA: OsmC family protein [Mycobacteriales bacterium]|nr:OsmC family protein [Mycobacteriales bacterium]